VATDVRVHVAKLCEEMRALAQEATMFLLRGGSTMKVLFSFVEGSADSKIYWVVVIRVGLVRAAIVRRRPH